MMLMMLSTTFGLRLPMHACTTSRYQSRSTAVALERWARTSPNQSHFRRVGGAYYQRQSSVYVHTNQKLFELFYTTQGEGRQAKVVRAAAGAKGFTPQQQQQQPQVSMQAQQQPAQGISEHMPDSLPDQVMTDEVKDCD